MFVYLDDILVFSEDLPNHVLHVKQVLQRLLENRLFVKAEKCDFHAQTTSFLGYIISEGQLKMDREKVRAVLDWPQPESRLQLQRFLGFANFYRRFIRDYSRVAAPLTALTSTSRSFCWNPAANEAFRDLKGRFTDAPILSHPDTSRQFVVEVDASDVGVGAILSQRSSSDHKLHPCAFFSRRLSPAERNYDVGNRELLAAKLALEWRHWLEGPFVVWTDHKNLAYVQSARRLNSRQARWALFFGRFNFSLTFRPGSRNGKADALSRMFSKAVSEEATPETILPQKLIVGVVTWRIEDEVMTALRTQPWPGNGPQGVCLYQTLSVLLCFNGPTPASWLVTLEWLGPWPYCADAFGGRPWETRLGVSLLHARCALKIRVPTDPALDSSILCPYLGDHGHIWLWISCPGCPYLRETPLS